MSNKTVAWFNRKTGVMMKDGAPRGASFDMSEWRPMGFTDEPSDEVVRLRLLLIRARRGLANYRAVWTFTADAPLLADIDHELENAE